MKSHLFMLGALLAFYLSTVNCGDTEYVDTLVHGAGIGGHWFDSPASVKVLLRQAHAEIPIVKARLRGPNVGCLSLVDLTVTDVDTASFIATITTNYDKWSKCRGQQMTLLWTEESTVATEGVQAFETLIGASYNEKNTKQILVKLRRPYLKPPLINAVTQGPFPVTGTFETTVSEVTENNFIATIRRSDSDGGWNHNPTLYWTETSDEYTKKLPVHKILGKPSRRAASMTVPIKLQSIYKKAPIVKVWVVGDLSPPHTFSAQIDKVSNKKFFVTIKRTDPHGFSHWWYNIRILWTELDQDELSKVPKLQTPESCKEVFVRQPNKTNGVYRIKPYPILEFDVFCDIDNGGWIVIQRRFDGSLDFARNLAAYRKGFGKLDGGEFWLGLLKMRKLTQHGRYLLRIEVESWEGETKYALYEDFKLGPGPDFKLHIGDYINGTVGYNALKHSYNQKFIAYDRVRGPGERVTCVNIVHGAFWWGAMCGSLNINSLNFGSSGPTGMTWFDSHGKDSYWSTPLRKTVMKIKKY